MTTNRCQACGRPESFPTVEELFPKGIRKPYTTKLLYEALQQPGGITLDGLRTVAWPDKAVRYSKNEGTINILIKRLDQRLAKFGLAIARVGFAYDDRYYRLVGL